MSKKAQTIMNIVESLWEVILVVIVIICLLSVVFYYLNEKMEVENAEMQALYTRFIYSPSCLAYQDLIKSYPGVIDYQKFVSKNIPACGIKDSYGVRLSLKNLQGTMLISQLKLITSYQENQMAVCDALPNYKCFKKSSFVQYRTDEGQLKPAILDMEVIKDAEQ